MMFRYNPKVYRAFACIFAFACCLGVILWLFPEVEPYMFFLDEDHRVVESIPFMWFGFMFFNEMYEMAKKIKELESGITNDTYQY